LAHETVNALVVDLPALPVQLRGDPAVSIGGPFSRHSLDGLFQALVFFLDPGSIVIAAAAGSPAVGRLSVQDRLL